jgi:hypothetical protein
VFREHSFLGLLYYYFFYCVGGIQGILMCIQLKSEISTEMAANFPERTKSEPQDLRELWRRMTTKAKVVAREKKIDMGCEEGLA